MNKFFNLKMNANTPKTLDLYIYTDVESDYWDWWTGKQVESQTSAEYIRKELEAAGDVTQINIYINSLGGSVMEGMAIYNQLRRHKAHKTLGIYTHEFQEAQARTSSIIENALNFKSQKEPVTI